MTLTNKNRGLVDGDLEWLRTALAERPGVSYTPALNARIDRILQALSTTQEEDPDLKAVEKAAYKRGWNDRESDILERAERILPAAQEEDGSGEAFGLSVGTEAWPDRTPTPPEREAVERIKTAMKFTTQLRAKDTGYSTIVTVELEDLRTILSLLESRHGG